MKKTLFLFLVIFSLAAPSLVLAQTSSQQQVANQCIYLSSTNYDRCCAPGSTLNDPGRRQRCDAYAKDLICSVNPTDPSCAAVSGPRGSSLDTGGVNDAPVYSTVGTVPKSGSLDLAECSAIRFKSVLDILIWIKCIIARALIPLIFSLAFLVFLWGVFKFIRASDPKAKQEGQKFIWWGMLGLFVMVSVWGIIKIVSDTLGFDSKVVPVLQTEYLKK